MSLQLTKEQILFHQRILRGSDLYLDSLDGIWGKHTEDSDRIFSNLSKELCDIGRFDVRTETNIFSLVLKAQKICREFLVAATDAGFNVRVISGTRSYSQQDDLYAQGRTKSGNKVTNARGGQSLHNFGIAWDIGLFSQEGHYITDNSIYIEFKNKVLVGDLKNELSWGGDWKSLKDNPHYQLKTSTDAITFLRYNFENGNPYYI